MIDRKFNTHTVIKNADIDRYLAKKDANDLKALIKRLRVSKACNSLSHKENSYYVVNTDEPYAEKVLQVILNGEKEKIQSEQEETCYSLKDCEMKQDNKCNLFGPCPHQSKEKINFDVITESPDKLVELIKLMAMAKTVYYPGTGEISFDEEGIADYLNQKAGE